MIRGELVTLRAVQPSDYPRLTEFKNDVEAELLGSTMPPRPTTLAEVSQKQEDWAKNPDSVSFAIEADDVFIGDCGLSRIERIHGTAQIGIGIGDRNCWGKGYGRDAVAALVHYGFTMQNLRKINLGVHASNERAIRCYRSVGFLEEGRLREQVWNAGEYSDEVLMGLLRSDWMTYQKPLRRPRHLNVTDDSDD